MNKKNIYEIAEEAGVSIATVSRAMNAKTRPLVRKETLDRVDAVIAKRNYVPSLSARSMAQQSYKTIGVVMPHGTQFFRDPYYMEILAGIADALYSTGYRFKLILLETREGKWDGYDLRSAEGVDGAILTHWYRLFSSTEVLDEWACPNVLIGDPEGDPGRTRNNSFCISGNHKEGGRLVAEYLYSKGHREVSLMYGLEDSTDSNLRGEGFCEYFAEKNCPIDEANVLRGNYQQNIAAEVSYAFLEDKPEVTAMFCTNDAMACGVIESMKVLGLRCPEDLSIVGYDNVALAQKSDPSLTSVQVPLYEIARQACGELIQHLEAGEELEEALNYLTYVPVRLVERESVAELSEVLAEA